MNNPNRFRVNTDFASSGNDSSTILTTTVPNHTLTTDRTFQNSVSAPSRWDGKQIRAQITITSGVSGAQRVPFGFCMAVLQGTFMGSPVPFYVFMDVSRITSSDIRLRVRTINFYQVPSVSVPTFTVEARVRTVIGN